MRWTHSGPLSTQSTLNSRGGGRRWLMLTGMSSAKQQSTQELKGKHGKCCIWPSESQKAKALWAMKAAWDRGEEFYDPARKEDILGRTITRLNLCEELLKDPLVALAKSLECLENSL